MNRINISCIGDNGTYNHIDGVYGYAVLHLHIKIKILAIDIHIINTEKIIFELLQNNGLLQNNDNVFCTHASYTNEI